MLSYKAEIFSFSKTLIQSVSFLIPFLFHYCILYVKEKNIDNGGVPVRGEGEQGERAKNTDERD